MKGLKPFFLSLVVLVCTMRSHAELDTFDQLVTTPEKVISNINFMVSSKLSEATKAFIISYSADTAYIKTQYNRCQPYDFIIKQKTSIENNLKVNSFHFERCGQLSEVLTFKTDCQDSKAFTLQDLITGHWPAVQNCKSWELTNTFSGLKINYLKDDRGESTHLYLNDHDLVYDVKITSTSVSQKRQILTHSYIGEDSGTYQQQYSAVESYSPNTQISFLIDGEDVAPAIYAEQYQKNLTRTLKNVIYNYGVWNTLFNFID